MGLLEQNTQLNSRLLYVLSDGAVREKVELETEGSQKRVNKNGVEIAEMVYPGIKGFITAVELFHHPEHGTKIWVKIKDANEEEFILSLEPNSPYGENFLHKLPNIDFTKEITIKPYNFEADGRRNTGVSLMQEDVKLQNAFNTYDKDKGEWQTLVEGYPQPDAKTKEKGGEKWTIFFAMRRDWLIEYLTEKGLITESAPVAEKEDEDNF